MAWERTGRTKAWGVRERAWVLGGQARVPLADGERSTPWE